MTKFLTLALAVALLACQSVSRDPLAYVELETPAGDTIKTTIVYTMADQTRGLSGTRPGDFADDQGMLFFYLRDDEKHFWMPDTYFDLDLVYLDKDLRVLEIIRKVPHYVGRANEHLIPRVRGVWARHALEMKASSALAARLKVGDQLRWNSSLGLAETEEKIRAALDR